MSAEISDTRTEILPPLHGYAGPGHRAASAIAAAGVVHDLGNLIQIATSAINIIARTPEMPAIHSRPMLDRAKVCLEHAGALVRQNLRRVRERTVDDVRSNVTACLAEVVAIIEATEEAGPVLQIDVERALPELGCDPMDLRRAVLNLVVNARDAMAGERPVLIRARSVFRNGFVAGVELQVTDQGVGMSEATIARIFEPYFTTKTGGLGGLGLHTVERFVRAAGGQITVTSELGVGTSVTLLLPAALKTAISPEESDQ